MNINVLSVSARNTSRTIPKQLVGSTWIQNFKNPKYHCVSYIHFKKHILIQGFTQSDQYYNYVDHVYRKGNMYIIKTHEDLTHSKYTYKVKKIGKKIFLYYTDSSNNTRLSRYFYTNKKY